MVNGHFGEDMALAARPAKVDTVPDIELVIIQHQRTVVLIVREMDMKVNLVEVMSTAL